MKIIRRPKVILGPTRHYTAAILMAKTGVSLLIGIAGALDDLARPIAAEACSEATTTLTHWTLYYGGAGSVVCFATAIPQDLLDHLHSHPLDEPTVRQENQPRS